MVATAHPLAAQAGLSVLQAGGNAIDAALAAATCLTVVAPTHNGIGGDLFALVSYEGALFGVNSSGPAPIGLTPALIKRGGVETMPRDGPLTVTVPGAPAAWGELALRFGRLPLKRSMKDAIELAAGGFPVAHSVATSWRRLLEKYQREHKESFYKSWFDTFCPNGHAPKEGEIFHLPDHARTLDDIAASGARTFYEGELAVKLVRYLNDAGNPMGFVDLSTFRPEWVSPISVNYRGIDVWEMPPNGQGIAALIALNILRDFEFDRRDDARTYHIQIEAMKLALADVARYVGEDSFMKVTVNDLLSEGYAIERRKLITDHAMPAVAGAPANTGTVCVVAADNDGNMVSLFQSNYYGFGSGLVVPGTGIALHSRGSAFCLDRNHPNGLVPGKRPFHTLSPGLLTLNGNTIAAFGMMGATMQPQGHLQMIMNALDFNLNPQASLDAPRWQFNKGLEVELETWTANSIAESLEAFGHHTKLSGDTTSFGRAQIILKNPHECFCGATDGRTDGYIAAY